MGPRGAPHHTEDMPTVDLSGPATYASARVARCPGRRPRVPGPPRRRPPGRARGPRARPRPRRGPTRPGPARGARRSRPLPEPDAHEETATVGEGRPPAQHPAVVQDDRVTGGERNLPYALRRLQTARELAGRRAQ